MLSAVTQLFTHATRAESKAELHPRRIDLSGNIFQFSMPEDFSKDMPAHDMIESLDITNPSAFDDPQYGNLIRRWWDIKAPGWFGKRLGTVMIDISVQRTVENKEKLLHDRAYDPSDRMDFMLMLDDRYHQTYDALNAESDPEPGRATSYHSSIFTLMGQRLESNHREYVLNQQKWIENSVVGPRSELTTNLALPVTRGVFLNAAFTYAKNDNVLLREFLDIAFAKMSKIQASFYLQYDDRNPFASVVGVEWLKRTNDDVLDQHRRQILQLFEQRSSPPTGLTNEEQEITVEAPSQRQFLDQPKSGPL